MTRAIFIGRFQPFHLGHLFVVKKLAEKFDSIIIAIGSSQEKGTLENPFSYNERKEMIANVLKKHKIKNYGIYPLPDFYDDKKWTGYIKKNLPKADFFYSGNRWTLRCLKKHGYKARKIKLIGGINSTNIRKMMLKKRNWERLVPQEIAEHIKKLIK